MLLKVEATRHCCRAGAECAAQASVKSPPKMEDEGTPPPPKGAFRYDICIRGGDHGKADEVREVA